MQTRALCAAQVLRARGLEALPPKAGTGNAPAAAYRASAGTHLSPDQADLPDAGSAARATASCNIAVEFRCVSHGCDDGGGDSAACRTPPLTEVDVHALGFSDLKRLGATLGVGGAASGGGAPLAKGTLLSLVLQALGLASKRRPSAAASVTHNEPIIGDDGQWLAPETTAG